MKRVLALILSLAMLLSLAACGSKDDGKTTVAPSQTEAPAKVVDISMGGSTTSTWVYSFTIAMTEEINPKLKLSQIYPEATSGSSAHYELLDNGSIQLGTGATFTDEQAMNGTGSFTKAYDSICSLFPVNYSVCQVIVNADSNITDIKNLEGINVAIGGRGSPTSAMSEAVVDALGINCNLTVSTHEEMIEMFKDNRVEAIIYFGGAPYSGILDASSAKKVRIIGLTQEEADAVHAKYPSLSVGSIEKSAYEFMTEDIITVRSMSNVNCRKDVPDDVIYEIVKATFEGWDNIAAVVPAAANIHIEDVNAGVFKIHPGALKYYEERGVKIDDRLK